MPIMKVSKPSPQRPRVKKFPIAPMLLVPELDNRHDLFSFIRDLQDCISTKPREITLTFLGMQRYSPDSALIIYDTLQLKDAATVLFTDARSPLTDAGVLLWLAGDQRRIRSTAWMRFAGPKKSQKRARHWVPWETQMESWQQESEDTVTVECRNPNYQSVLKLINRHLPVTILADRLLTPHVLGEFGLI